MRQIYFLFALIFLTACGQKKPQAIVYTSSGDILLELFQKKAPLTVSNFKAYADAGLYDGTTFFRTCTPENEADREIKIEVIQGGNIDSSICFPPIEIETTQQTGVRHTNGAISMARNTPNSAQSDFFICIGDMPSLDFKGKRNPDGYGFAAFGVVTKGMDVVKIIQSMDNKEQMLIAPITIDSIRVIQ